MEKVMVTHCPRCSNNLIATHLKCKECDLEITGNFGLSQFDYLSNDELDFVITFLKYHGNFKAIQMEKNMSYPSVKKKLLDVVIKLGIKDVKQDEESLSSIPKISYLNRDKSDSPVVGKIKEKLNSCGGKTTIKLLRGEDCDIWFDVDGKGLVSPKIPPANQLLWSAFDAAVEVVVNNGGIAAKGNARSGAKLGSDALPLNSVEGYIAHKVHGVQKGESAFGPGFVISAVLDWAGICKNERGFLSINPNFVKECKDC